MGVFQVKRKISQLTKKEEETAVEIYERSLFINALDACWPRTINRAYLLEWKKAGLDAANFGSIVMPWMTVHLPEFWQRLASFELTLAENSDIAVKVTTADGVKRAYKEGKIACIFGTQSPELIEKDLNLLRSAYDMGFRVFGLAYQHRNFVADGCGEKANGGLSLFGENVVKELNKLGMLIDLSHVGVQSSLDAINLSKDPCVFSHSNPRIESTHNRTLIDEEMLALAEKGGAICLSAYSPFFKGKGEYAGRRAYDATVEDFMDHIDYVAKLVGIDHVGIGIDYAILTRADMIYGMWERYPDLTGQLYDPTLQPPSEDEAGKCLRRVEGLRWQSDYVNVAKGMVARGYSEQEIQKVLGLNVLRLFEKVFRE